MMQVQGKRGRKVPVLIPHDCLQPLNIVTRSNVRLAAGINPENTYIFASRSGTYIRGCDSIRKISQTLSGNLDDPESLRATKLRKYTATVCQLLNLGGEHLEWLTSHLGHNVDVHKIYYRLNESTIEMAKIAKLMMAVDTGQIGQFKGKSLDDISLEGKR